MTTTKTPSPFADRLLAWHRRHAIDVVPLPGARALEDKTAKILKLHPTLAEAADEAIDRLTRRLDAGEIVQVEEIFTFAHARCPGADPEALEIEISARLDGGEEDSA